MQDRVPRLQEAVSANVAPVGEVKNGDLFGRVARP